MDFHVQNIGNRHVWSLWHRFYGNKWKKINIWQPCDSKSGNPVGRGISKISQFDFLVLNMSTCRFWSLWHRFYGKKMKKLNIWQPCNAKSGNPVGRRVSKISSFNFLCQIRGYRKFGAYFHDKKLKTKR